MPYLATINTPGYLPWDDEPPTFEASREAWGYLLDQRREAEDDAIMAGLGTGEGYSATLNQIERAMEDDPDYVDWEGAGTVYGTTPGYDGDHDLGLAYSVTVVESWY